MQYERSVTVDMPYIEAVPKVRELLDELQPVADEASERLQVVLDSLARL